MYTIPSEEFPLQEEGQTCCASEENCFAWLWQHCLALSSWWHGHGSHTSPCSSNLNLRFHSDRADWTLVWITMKENQKRDVFQEHPHSQGSTHRFRLLQHEQPPHSFLKQWIVKCPWDMGVTCQQKFNCKLWKNQFGYPGSYCYVDCREHQQGPREIISISAFLASCIQEWYIPTGTRTRLLKTPK